MMSNTLIVRLEAQIKRFAALEAGEIKGLLASFGYFFCVLTAYYIVRPIREELNTALNEADPAALKNVFTYVFGIMLLAVPVFGWLVTRFDRRRLVPIVYLFFIANLLLFALAMRGEPISQGTIKAYAVWASVFNLFVISLFWSVMATFWQAGAAKRLYGMIAVGGQVGALSGPLIAQTFAPYIGRSNLLIVAALFLIGALSLALLMPRLLVGDRVAPSDDKPAVTLASVLDGARRAWADPFLFRIAMWVLLANLISTYFYFEQSTIVGAVIKDKTERLQLFARMDLAVGLLAIFTQMFGTARIIQRYGLGLAMASLPAAAILSFFALSLAPTLPVIIAIVILERAIHFSFSSPAAKILWTSVEPLDKYKAQNFVDTVVYRGGDAASGWFYGLLGRDWLLLGTIGVSLVSLPIALVWCWLSFELARRFEERTGKQASGGAH
jgi:ATP:ADP antiporter, AAA family